ncbi:MAG: hypothetical protein AB7F88_15840 [Pyrinomonadaceae bacterium]
MFVNVHRLRSFRSGPFVAAALVFLLLSITARAQTVVDKTVVTVSDGLRTELITYSDLRWQLALQPGVPLSPMRPEDLANALNLLINQRIFALEAERIPRQEPSKDAVEAEIKRILAAFPSTAEFERRLRQVGFDSVKDDNFQLLIAERIAIENYIDFRFRSFIVNTPEEQARYYNETFVPDFRQRYPGVLMPTLEEKRKDIYEMLTEAKLAANIEAFLDDAKRRVDIVTLNPI